MRKKMPVLLILVLFVLSACSPAAPTKEDMMDDSATEAMMGEAHDDEMAAATEEMMEESDDAMSGEEMMTPAFFDISLTNVNTGESFMLSDFAGKVVVVENLAMWCPNCKKQQEEVKKLSEMLGMDSDVILVGFDVDPNENAADLKNYVDSNGFDWVYAVPPQTVLNEISNLLGANFLNPPSTPIFVIDRKGEIHPMEFGFKSVEDLQQFIDPFLAEGL